MLFYFCRASKPKEKDKSVNKSKARVTAIVTLT